MGKRRIRNLHYLGYQDIIGCDMRRDRCKEANKLYGIKVFDKLKEAVKLSPDAVIISTPPNAHGVCAKECIRNELPCFMELNVFDWEIEEVIEMAKKANVLVAPSNTLRNYSAVKRMKELIDRKTYGKPLAFTCHAGQYLLNWHPWEGLNFYMSDKKMGGAIEVASFDLVWITWLFGYPCIHKICGVLQKVSGLNADIYDVCNLIMQFPDGVVGHLMTDVISRVNERHVQIFCQEAVIEWNWGAGLCIRRDDEADKVFLPKETITHAGYSDKIKEDPYIAEISNFIGAVEGKIKYPYTLEEAKKRLYILEVLKRTNM